uniref:C2H2-type domain-containing protein n=1 Tax=Salmo trutta TaxID=8032 RepID=A0A673XWT0_SALTR
HAQRHSNKSGKGRSSNDRRHSGQQVPVNKYQCSECDRSFTDGSLVKHIRMKHQTQKNMDVVNHVKEKETAVKEEFDMEVDVDGGSNASNDEDEDENDANEDNDSDSADYFPCHVCGKTFTTSESLEDHQRCHLGEKPHECAECGKCFFQAGQLQQHLRSHKDELLSVEH